MYYLRKIFLHSPGHYIAALILAVAAGVFRYCGLSADVGARYAVYETLSVAGAVTFLIGGLMTVAYFGAFDLFSYTFSAGRRSGKYRDYADYSQKTAEKRSDGSWYFVPYYAVGLVLFLLSLLYA